MALQRRARIADLSTDAVFGTSVVDPTPGFAKFSRRVLTIVADDRCAKK
jgi:hypothetical protein